MSTVGIRDLKARLSEYLRKVRKGQVVVVTDRGVPVAEIRAPRKRSTRSADLAGLQDLIDRGVVSEGRPKDPSLYVPTGIHCPPGTARRVLDELREDRC